jgi:hypothetical protein
MRIKELQCYNKNYELNKEKDKKFIKNNKPIIFK